MIEVDKLTKSYRTTRAIDRIGFTARPGRVTALLGPNACAGYWTKASRLPAPPGVPYLRNYQRMASEAAFRWVLHRRGA